MKCRNVLEQLSPYVDEMLGSDVALEVSSHIAACAACGDELERLRLLRSKLHSLGKVTVPDFLRDLVQIHVNAAERDTWRARIRDAWEYRWSRIQTTEGTWYLTRVLGTAVTAVFFFWIYAAVSPIVIDFPGQTSSRGAMPLLRQQLGINVLKNLGLLPVEAQRRPISPSDPSINDLYLLDFGQIASRTGSDDSFSVVASVDQKGSARIQNVLEYPTDGNLLDNFNSMILSARCRPASYNGRAVESHLVLAFSKISVYD